MQKGSAIPRRRGNYVREERLLYAEKGVPKLRWEENLPYFLNEDKLKAKYEISRAVCPLSKKLATQFAAQSFRSSVGRAQPCEPPAVIADQRFSQ